MSKTSVPNEALSKLRFFSQLDPQQLAAFRRIAVRRKFAVGATVVRQGDLDSQLYAVTQGLLQVSVALSDSREIVLHLLRPGDLFGEVTLFDQKPRSATVTAMQPSELLSFPRDEVLSTLRHYPDVALKLLESMAGLIRRLTDRVEDLSALAVPARLAKKLLELADICGTPVGRNQVALPFSLSQQHLANHVQASREAVNKSIAVMVKQGLLHQTKCQIMILDRKNLAALAEAIPRTREDSEHRTDTPADDAHRRPPSSCSVGPQQLSDSPAPTTLLS